MIQKGLLAIALLLVTLLLMFALLREPEPPPPFTIPDPESVHLTEVARDIFSPINVAHAGDDRVFIVSRIGDVWVLDGETRLSIPFLNISSRLHRNTFTVPDSQNGLLGMAFDPDYAENGRFYLSYTNRNGEATLARYTRSDIDPNIADWSSEEVLYTYRLPRVDTEAGDRITLNGGRHLAFGPDGLLYWSIGDGGREELGAPLAPDTPLGSILRFDVRGDTAEPAGNGFEGGLPEVWATGLRNPWRFGFDADEFYVTDIGAASWDEINVVPVENASGAHFGWSYFEGESVLFGEVNTNAPPENPVGPALTHAHAFGSVCALIGGTVYRGEALPGMGGYYIYGDHCSGDIWAATRDPDGAWVRLRLLSTDLSIVSFGEDAAGALYVLDEFGAVFRLDPTGL